MINFRLGASYSLLQTNIVVPVNPSLNIVAGSVVHPDATTKLLALGGATTDLVGFAINNQSDTDVIAAGTMGVLLLDGGSVIETDQVVEANIAGSYPEGTVVYASSATPGKVTTTGGGNKQVGVAVGSRSIPGVQISVTNATTGLAQLIQGSVTVLQIKLLGA